MQVITSARNEAFDIVQKAARNKGSLLWDIAGTISFGTVFFNLDGVVANIETPKNDHRELDIPLIGMHHRERCSWGWHR